MRGMAPGENKFHRVSAKTEFSQQGRKNRRSFTEGNEGNEGVSDWSVGLVFENPSLPSLASVKYSLVSVAFAALL